jgi:hypothetical protein
VAENDSTKLLGDMPAAQSSSQHQGCSVVAHKGEVLLVLNPATGIVVMPPEAANSMGSQLQNAAEMAYKQRAEAAKS